MEPNSQHEPTVFQRIDRGERAPYTLGEYFRRYAWSAVWLTIWRLPRAWGWRRFLLRAFGATVGDGSIIHSSASVYHPWLLTMGQHCVLGKHVVIYNLGPVSIGSHSVVSQEAYICAGTHDYTLSHLPLVRDEIKIGAGVWIAAQAFIGPGVHVGDNSVVGARAVVARDVAEAVVVAGNPARIIKPRLMRSGPDASGPRDLQKSVDR